MKQHNTISRVFSIAIVFIFLFTSSNSLVGQTLDITNLNPKKNFGYPQIGLDFGSFNNPLTRFSWDPNLLPVGPDHAFNISTYGNRGINFSTGTGNVLFFPNSRSKNSDNKIGVHLLNPAYTLDITGDFRSSVNTNQGNVEGIAAKNSFTKSQNVLVGLMGKAMSISLIENNNKFSSYPSNTPIGKKKPIVGKPIFKTPESIAAGASFIANITNPIPSNKTDIGIYRIGGMVSLLQGNITNYPKKGAVAAVYGEDQINSLNTFAGYFDGKVAIGTNDVPLMTTAGGKPYLLFLDGGGIATEFRVKQGPWPDYVFAPEYIRPTIEEEIQYIREHGHLMGFQSAEEMGEYMELGDVTVRQQTKIEEMRLDMFEMHEENQSLKTELKKLQEEQKEIKELLKKLLEK